MFDIVQFSFNYQRSSLTGKTSFEIVCGRQPLMPNVIDHPCAGKSLEPHNFIEESRQTLEVVHAYLEKTS